MIIVHRCSCGHPDFHHQPGGGRCDSCHARRHDLTGPPELIRTFVDGQVNRYIHKPGTRFVFDIHLCPCDQCRALYKAKKNSVRPPQPPWYYRKPVKA